MKRRSGDYLVEWRARPDRKPLVVRGARQVGKSHTIMEFGESFPAGVVVVDFERNPEDRRLFASKDPRTILGLIEPRVGRHLVPGHSLLFLDEVQAAPEVFASLRYFHEDLPEQHVAAAGSLLDFALLDPQYSMPVGRLEFLHLGPLDFAEFVEAVHGAPRKAYLERYELGDELPLSLHEQYCRYVREFLVVGGMPEAVSCFSKTRSFIDVERIQRSLLSTFRADFSKYAERVPATRLDSLFTKLPLFVGRKLKYAHLEPNERSRNLKVALHKLELARVAYRVQHTSASGLPLAAQVKPRDFKVIFVDVGLVSAATGVNAALAGIATDLLAVNSGALAEQFVGQHLLHSQPFYIDPQLHYWVRQERGAAAEVDYVIEHGPHVVPVEVKSGSTGSLKSLRVFMQEKRTPLAVRFNMDVPSFHEVSLPLANGASHLFRLLSIPLYLVTEVRRLCEQALTR